MKYRLYQVIQELISYSTNAIGTLPDIMNTVMNLNNKTTAADKNS